MTLPVQPSPEEGTPVTHQSAPAGLLSNRTYDILKRFITLVIPAFGTFYVTVATLANWPGREVVAGFCLALATFLGVVLEASGRAYANSEDRYDGVIKVTEEEGVKQAALILKNYENPADVVKQKEVTFRVLDQ